MTTPLPTGETARARLFEIIRDRSFQTGAPITLASGRQSTFYFNMKLTMLDPEGAHCLGDMVLDALEERGIDADFVGGLEMGAVPIVSILAAASHRRGRPVRAIFMRKQAKDHGTQSLIEGLKADERIEGKTVVIVEDVTTTGGSALKAVEAVRAAGGSVSHLVTLVDREEGARETITEHGLELIALFPGSAFTGATA